MIGPIKLPVTIIAHRGHGPTSKDTAGPSGKLPEGLHPENSMQAFQFAIENGADGIEFDVYVSKDGIPMVIHDDELNFNVYQAKRDGKDLGLLSEKTAKELAATDEKGKYLYPLGPNNEKIPTLEELLIYTSKVNNERKLSGKSAIILNIELKGHQCAKPAWELINKYIREGKIPKESIMYCSFKYDELRTIRKLDKKALIAPSIKTATLYGEENVIKPGWYVPLDKTYQQAGIDYLQQLHDELHFCAFDAVLWDIEQGLVELARKNHITIHASTSDFRPPRQNMIFMQNLLRMGQELGNIIFKTDEPKIVREVLQEEEKTLHTLDLSSVTISKAEILDKGKVSTLKRLPKPGSTDAALKY